MNLSVIISNYTLTYHFENCLDSLINQTIDHNSYEIICVDGGSPNFQDIKSIITNKKFNNLTLYHQKRREKYSKNPSSALNFGARRASGDKILLFPDSAILVDPNCLSLLLENMRANLCLVPFNRTIGENIPNRWARYSDTMEESIDYLKSLFNSKKPLVEISEPSSTTYACPVDSRFACFNKNEFFNIGGFDELNFQGWGFWWVSFMKRFMNMYSVEICKNLNSYHQVHPLIRDDSIKNFDVVQNLADQEIGRYEQILRPVIINLNEDNDFEKIDIHENSID